MLRKVVQHGPSTMTVSLPIKWVKENHVQKGDELVISEENNRVVIGTQRKAKKNNITIDITNLNRNTIMFYLRSLYRQGLDEIEIYFENTETIYYDTGKQVKVISTIHQEVNRLIGFEVTQEKDQHITIADLSGTSDSEIEPIIKRIFYLMNDAIDESIIGMRNKNYKLLDSIEEKHNTITKFISYCLRMINKKPNSGKCVTGAYHTLCSFDVTADMMKYFVRHVVQAKQEFSKEGIAILEDISKLSEMTKDIFFKLDLQKVKLFMKKRAEVKRKINIFTRRKDFEATLIAYMTPTVEIFRDLVETKMSTTDITEVKE